MATPYSTQGQTLRIGQQANIATASTFGGDVNDGDIRYDDTPTVPTDIVNTELQANTGRENSFDKSDEPIVWEGVREGALTVPLLARGSATNTDVPPLVAMLESGGCASAYYTDTTVAAYTDANDFTLTAWSPGADAYGQAVAVTLDSGIVHPVLASKVTNATKDILPMMDEPEAADLVGNAVPTMHTVTPRTRMVPAGKHLSFRYNTRDDQNTGEDLTWQATGCALSDIGTLEVTPNEKTVWSPSFHVCDVLKIEEDLDTDVHIDLEKYLRTDGNFMFEFGTNAPGGEIGTATLELQKATINFGLTTVPVPGEGTTANNNSTQAFMSVYEQATVELQLIMDKAYFDDVSASTFANKYMAFLWRSTANSTNPSMGIWFPNCYQIGAPTWDGSGQWGVMTCTYGATSAKMTGTTTTNASSGMAPWYIGIGHGYAGYGTV